MGVLASFAAAISAEADSSSQSLAPIKTAAVGQSVAGVDAAGRWVLANEPDGAAGVVFDFDLAAVDADFTPQARITLELEKLPVKRLGENATVERGAIHVLAVDAEGRETLAGSMHVKPGGTVATYPLVVTDAVNAVLARRPAERKLRLAIRLAGKPIPFEVYALPATAPSLEIASSANWTDDHDKRVSSVLRGVEVYREACLPLTEDPMQEVELKLLYPVRKVTEMIVLATGEHLQEGRDWVVRDGRVVLPVGSRAPVQVASEFFLVARKDSEGSSTEVRSAVKLMPGSWYHERQIEVSYEPLRRDWTWPKRLSSLEQLPRTQERLRAKLPLLVILFGDSISEGFDASGRNGVWPYQPGYGDLVIRKLRQVYGAPITFMNHARAGGTSAHATTQVDAQVAWFKPDLVLLAYGMNDRSEQRRVAHRENLEKIIDAVRVRSPETEFVIITPMVNNPKQATGLDPVKFIRDEALRIDRPGVALVDMTSTQISLLERKDYLDLSGNGANHPNDFLHRIYAQRVLEVLIP